ncbi:probable endonuclease 4 isoform X2 [Portunus trituberculatus]|uniref:probable endonuclease 4 isoform X2 n=1 Tax=Portunus trituberculatus TaxID=210409 RepID=UPI001E1CDA7E|nr:probable endonuclease 4 isoform X2 [Portunus trituberculatus]
MSKNEKIKIGGQKVSKNVAEDKMAKKKNARTAKKLDKRVVKREIENDNVVERREPPKKRIKKTTDSPAPHDSQPQATSGKRRRGKKVAKSDTEEPSEDIKAVKIEVKGETDAPTKKFKKGEDVPVPRPLKYESLGSGPPPVPFTGRKYMGSHVSAAGGIWNAFDNAKECNSKSFAIFLRNQRQWNAKPLDEETVLKWKEVGKDFAPHLILPHGSYLMNLGSPMPEVLQKSRCMLQDELKRCQRLGIPHYNFHPGSTTGKITREECCKTIAESINIAHSQTEDVICVLENMSCQGFTIGGDFHELRLIIEHVKDKSRVGVCLDTCHSHAAEEGFKEFSEDFEKIIGWQFLRGLHINDSKGKPGDHLDRHENIGKGTIGLEGFRRVMNCDHFNDLPLILETPWTSNAGYASEVKKLESIIKK